MLSIFEMIINDFNIKYSLRTYSKYLIYLLTIENYK